MVMHRTSWYRSLMWNWQLKFHLGFRVSLSALDVKIWVPIVTSQYGLTLPGERVEEHGWTEADSRQERPRKITVSMLTVGFNSLQLGGFLDGDEEPADSTRLHGTGRCETHTHTHRIYWIIGMYSVKGFVIQYGWFFWTNLCQRDNTNLMWYTCVCADTYTDKPCPFFSFPSQ